MALRLCGKHAVDLRRDGGALSNGRRGAFSRAGPHVADGEHVGLAGLERQDSVLMAGPRDFWTC